MAKARLDDIDPSKELVSDTATQTSADVETPSAPDEVLRPSELRKMIDEYATEKGVPVKDIDPHKFIKEHGLPNPVKKFRVTSNRGMEPVEVEAWDEGEAIRRAAIIRDVPQNLIHTHQFRCVLIAG